MSLQSITGMIKRFLFTRCKAGKRHIASASVQVDSLERRELLTDILLSYNLQTPDSTRSMFLESGFETRALSGLLNSASGTSGGVGVYLYNTSTTGVTRISREDGGTFLIDSILLNSFSSSGSFVPMTAYSATSSSTIGFSTDSSPTTWQTFNFGSFASLRSLGPLTSITMQQNVGSGSMHRFDHVQLTVGPVPNGSYGVLPSRTAPMESVAVSLSETADMSTFTFEDLTLSRNGTPITLDSRVTVTYTSGTSYLVSGLGDFTATPGSYSLTVNCRDIKSAANGTDGMGSASQSWTTHSQPTITGASIAEGGMLSPGSLSLSVTFSETVAFSLGSQQRPATSASQIKNVNPTALSGVYWIDPDGVEGALPAKQVYCDMNNEGGGWMLGINSVANSGATSNQVTADTGTVGLSSGHTRNLNKYFEGAAVAEIRHEIDGGASHGRFRGVYTADFFEQTFGGMQFLTGHQNSNLMSGSFGAPFTTVPSYGSQWFYSGNPFTTVPSVPSSGNSGPRYLYTNDLLNSHRVWIRGNGTGSTPNSADLAANYELRGAGSDGVFQTADDILVSISSVSMSGNTATLSASVLQPGNYRLTVFDTIKNSAGVALDGNNDNVPGGNWTRNFIVNSLPSNIALTQPVVPGQMIPAMKVSDILVTDPDAGDVHSLALVSGPGDTDNAKFLITNGELHTSASFNSNSSQSFSIRVRATDSRGGAFEKVLSVTENRLVDPSFSTDGIAISSILNSVDQGSVVVEQPDGKTVVAGRSLNGSRYDLTVVRYNVDGTLDATFGTSGVVMIAIDSGNLNPTDIALDSFGRIVIVCEHQISGAGDFAVFRLGAGGSLDSSFNTTGFKIVDFGTLEDNPQSLVIEPNGRIVIVGESRSPSNGFADVAIARLFDNGQLDPGFHADGKNVYSFGSSHDIARSVVLQPNGSIVVGGYTLGAGAHWNFLAARFGPNGDLDPSFGSGGSIVQAIGSQSAQASFIGQLSDGRLILTGHAWNSTNVDAAYVRLTANGVLDNQPGNDAIRLIPFSASDDYFYSATVVNDKIVMAGSSSGAGGQVMAVMRLTANGEPDSNFDSDGRLTVHPGYDGGIAIDVATSPDGKLVVAGRSTEGSRQRFATARLFNPEAPTNIHLSSSTILENMPSGTPVGALSAADLNGYDSHTFELVPGTGDTDNSSFTIFGNTLRTSATFNFETKSAYSIRVRTVDRDGLSHEEALTINVQNVNEAPTHMSLSGGTVSENQSVGSTVGSFSTSDPDVGNTFSYSFVSGAGDSDNTSFAIDGNVLRTAAVFDFETQSIYSIRVRSTDQGGLSVEKTFTINVANVTELGRIDVQLGQTQRSYVRYLDAVFDRSDDLMSMIGSGRFQMTKRDLNGINPVSVPLTPSMFSVVGNSARIDFGSNGLGGNRNTNAGDGYYELGVDMDGNGSYESKKYFYRLLGDVNGDRKVDSVDSSLVTSSFGLTNPNRDVNGDGFVNSNDRTLILRSIGRKLKDDLFADD